MLAELNAEEQISAIRAASFSDMTNDSQRAVMDRLRAQLPSAPAAKPTKADLAAVGVRVREVPKKVKR